MAHKGKEYLLHFRRDFNLNVHTYRYGIADAYILQVLSNDVANPPPFIGQFVTCPRVAMPDLLTLRWLSDVQRSGGHTWRFRIELAITQPAPAMELVTFYLDRSDVPGATVWVINKPDTSDPFFHSTFYERTLYYDPTVFPVNPQYQNTVARPKSY